VTPDAALESAAGAILTGAAVDWAHLEQTVSGEQRRVVSQLRILAEVARLHGPADDGGEAQSSGRSSPPIFAWGSLEVLELIGHGAFGRVYRAWDRRLDRPVALKLLDESEPSLRHASGHVIREGRLLAKVHHPNVATIFGADRIDGTAGLWMEFVDGPTLAGIVAAEGPLPPEAVRAIGIDLCSALEAVHDAGLLHQDVKAQNVMRHRGGRIVLTDFGAGTDQLAAGGHDASRAGTPLYVAPEILRGAKPSVRSDIYSLGVLLYYAATGLYPVTADTLAALDEAHRGGRRVPLLDRIPSCPVSLAGVIERAIGPLPEHRFGSSREMQAALQAIALVPADEPRGGRAVPDARGTGLRRHSPMLVVSIALAATIAGLLYGAIRLPARNTLPVTSATPGSRQIPLPPRTAIGAPARSAGVLPYIGAEGRIMLLDPSSGAMTPVTEAAEDGRWPESVAVSPDGREVAYTLCPPSRGCELLVASGSSPGRVVASFARGREPQLQEWSAAGRNVLLRLWGDKGALTLALIDMDDGTLRTAREFQGEKPLGTSLSPDGRFLVFDLPSAGTRARDIHLLDIVTGAERAIVSHPADDAQPLWTPDGQGVFFLSDRSGVLEGWLLHGGIVEGGRVRVERVLETFARAAPWVGFGPGGRLYHWRQSGAYDVQLASLEPPAEPKPVPSRYSGSNRGPAWSPDGRYLAYVSMRYGGFELEPGTRLITIHDTMTGTERMLDPNLGIIPSPPIRWSPDGASLVCYCVSPQKEHGTYLIDVATSASRLVIPGPPQGWRTWSPDGQSLVIADRRDGLLAYDIASGAVRVLWARSDIPVVALNNFGFSPDGKQVAFSGWLPPPGSPGAPARRTSVLGIFSLEGGHRLVLTDENLRIDFQDWSPAGDELIVARAAPGAPVHDIWSVPVSGGQPRALQVTNTGNAAINASDLSPDGRVLALSGGSWHVELWAYENFLPRAP
jgi:Tol biopolymer transport system component